MKYSIDMSSNNPADWKLLRYGEPAGSKKENLGEFDNAHLEFWQKIEELQEEISALKEERDELKRQREELVSLSKELATRLIKWRGQQWPGTDQEKVILRDYPLLTKYNNR